jgi:hypothetical protein
MRWDALRYVRKLRSVSRSEKLVLFALAEYWNYKLQAAWPALPTLAADVDISERQLIRILQSLELPRDGHPEGILRRSRKSDGRGSVTEYSFVEIAEKGDIAEGKGDISDTERVTFSTQKGDISHAPIRKEPVLEPKEEPKNKHVCDALKNWLQIKAILKERLSEADFDLWVRPMYLQRVMDSGKFLLFALPPAHRVVEAARLGKDVLLQLVREFGHEGCGYTKYLDEYDEQRLLQQNPDVANTLLGRRKKEPQRVAG